MNLTYTSLVSGHPLIKNANGTLRLGRWWWIAPDTSYFVSEGTVGGNPSRYSMSQVASALTAAKGASAWTAKTSSGGIYIDPFVGTEFTEDYPYYDTGYMWSYGHASVVLYSFTVPVALRSRTIRSIVVGLQCGGATLLEWGSEAPDYAPYPLYADLWSCSGVCGYRFSSSKPSGPSAVGSAHTSVYFSTLTNAAVSDGAPIIYDSGNYWTVFDGGFVNVSAPSSVNAICQGLSKIWMCAFPTTIPAFSIPTDYSRALHTQNARGGIPSLWIYA